MESPAPSPRRWFHVALLALGCLLATLGAKSIYVERFGSDIPNWDQWEAESEYMLLPYYRGEFEFRDLFRPHNEHRIVPTKLLALGLVLANGQWDARLECLANAAMQSAIAAVLFLAGCRLIARRWHLPWLLAAFALFAAPMSWQNATSGFHTQQTFLIGFSLTAIHLLATGRTLSGRWWVGIACALASLVTMGSGLLAAVAAGATLALATPLREVVRRHGITIAVLVAIAALGWGLRTEVDYHAPLKAQSLPAFLLCFWRSLQWPVVEFPLYPLLGWLPFTWLAWRVWRLGDASHPGERVLAGAGIWTLLQYAASAYARGGHGDWPANRYLDTVALGIAVNVLALFVALSHVRTAGWLRAARATAAMAGMCLLGWGWWVHIEDTVFHAGPWLARGNVEKEALTRAYLRTGDEAPLHAGTLPHVSVPALVDRIKHPEIRAILPACVRAPLDLIATGDPPGAFAPGAVSPESPGPGGWPVIGSFSETAERATGVWRSALLPRATSGAWLIPVYRSQLESPELELTLVDESGHEITSLLRQRIDPIRLSTWGEVIVRAPRVPVRLVARDDTTTGWLAFGAPVEMGTLSFVSWRLAQAGVPLFWIGLALSLAGLTGKAGLVSSAASWTRRERDRIRAMPKMLALAGAVLGGGLCGFAFQQVVRAVQPAFFEARVSGDLHKRSMELFYDRGRGIRGEDSVQVWFEEYEKVRNLHLKLPSGTYRRLRVDPMDHGAALTIRNARIVDVNGVTLRELPPSTFVAQSQVASLLVDGSQLTVTSEPGALDSQLAVSLDPPLSTRPVHDRAWLRLLVHALCTTAGAVVGTLMLDRARQLIPAWRSDSTRPTGGATS